MAIAWIIKLLVAMSLALLAMSFAFRSLAYWRFPIGADEPYNAADVLDAIFMLCVFGTAGLLLLVSLFNLVRPGRTGRFWGIQGLVVAVTTGALCIPLHKLASHLGAQRVGGAHYPSVVALASAGFTHAHQEQRLTCRSTGAPTAGHLAREAYLAYPAPHGQGVHPSSPG
jgi:hypothetical protein